jgi:hypothetical protein
MIKTYTHYDSNATYRAVLAIARGSYQLSLLCGQKPWSGSNLQGKAKDFAGCDVKAHAETFGEEFVVNWKRNSFRQTDGSTIG